MLDQTANGAPQSSLGTPSRRQLLLGGAMLASAGLAWAGLPSQRELLLGNNKLEKIVPLTIGPWRYETNAGLVLPPSDSLSTKLYDQTLTRTYVSDSEPSVMFLIAYGSTQSDLLQMHRPEICYPSSGLKVTGTTPHVVPLAEGLDVNAISFSATGDQRIEQVLYWTRVGRYFPQSWTQQHLSRMAENLHGVVADGVLVRMSTLTDDAKGAEAVLERFARLMIHSIAPAQRQVLLGTDLGARLAKIA